VLNEIKKSQTANSNRSIESQNKKHTHTKTNKIKKTQTKEYNHKKTPDLLNVMKKNKKSEIIIINKGRKRDVRGVVA
jgi:hypothetical protein